MSEWTFEWEPHEDPEAHVREQLVNMRLRPRMYSQDRGMFLERVATLLEMAGVKGSTLVHLADKQGCAVIRLHTELTDEYAHETIDEALAILDGVKNGKIQRNPFRVHKHEP